MDLPLGCRPLNSKWLFKWRRKVVGSIEIYKVRLAIKDYKQTKGLDYFDIYYLVTRINSIKIVLAIDALRNLKVHHMNVKTIFLNRGLDEEIYIGKPERFYSRTRKESM